MKFLFIALLATGFVSSAQADWTSNLAGVATYTNDEGDNQDFTLQVQITEDAKTLVIKESAFEYTYTFDLMDGKILLAGTEVGSIDDNMIKLKYNDDGDCAQSFNITRGDTDIAYVDDYTCGSGYFDHVEGSLKTE